MFRALSRKNTRFHFKFPADELLRHRVNAPVFCRLICTDATEFALGRTRPPVAWKWQWIARSLHAISTRYGFPTVWSPRVWRRRRLRFPPSYDLLRQLRCPPYRWLPNRLPTYGNPQSVRRSLRIVNGYNPRSPVSVSHSKTFARIGNLNWPVCGTRPSNSP